MILNPSDFPYRLSYSSAAIYEYCFARLEYISYLIINYAEKNHSIPDTGDYAIKDLLQLLLTDGTTLSDPKGYEDFLLFLSSNKESSVLFEMLSPRVIKAMSDHNGRVDSLYDSKMRFDGDRLIYFCFIRQSPISSDFICIGVNTIKYETFYPKILASIKNGYYFSDINGSPYEGGENIVVMLKIPGTVTEQEIQKIGN
jgi:hypothetical protein